MKTVKLTPFAPHKTLFKERQKMRNFLPHRFGKSSSFFHLNPLLLPLEWNSRKQSLVTAVVVFFWVCNKSFFFFPFIHLLAALDSNQNRRIGGIERCFWVEHHTKKWRGIQWTKNFLSNEQKKVTIGRAEWQFYECLCNILSFFRKGLTFFHLLLFKEGFKINQNRNFWLLFHKLIHTSVVSWDFFQISIEFSLKILWFKF